MADPFAPPADAPARRRPAARAQPAEAEAFAEEPDSGRHSEPARAGTFWMVAAIGIGLLCLARLLQFFSVVGDLSGEDVAPALFGVFGAAALSIGLALAAILQRGLTTPVRTALLLGAGYFAVSGNGFTLSASLASLFN